MKQIIFSLSFDQKPIQIASMTWREDKSRFHKKKDINHSLTLKSLIIVAGFVWQQMISRSGGSSTFNNVTTSIFYTFQVLRRERADLPSISFYLFFSRPFGGDDLLQKTFKRYNGPRRLVLLFMSASTQSILFVQTSDSSPHNPVSICKILEVVNCRTGKRCHIKPNQHVAKLVFSTTICNNRNRNYNELWNPG